MEKDFNGWNSKKKQIIDHVVAPFYHKREIWWGSLGVNVGFEQDGTGSNYARGERADDSEYIKRGEQRESCIRLSRKPDDVTFAKQVVAVGNGFAETSR